MADTTHELPRPDPPYLLISLSTAPRWQERRRRLSHRQLKRQSRLDSPILYFLISLILYFSILKTACLDTWAPLGVSTVLSLISSHLVISLSPYVGCYR